MAATAAIYSGRSGFDSLHDGRVSSLPFVSPGSCYGSTLTASIHRLNFLFTDIHRVNAIYLLENASLNKLKRSVPHLLPANLMQNKYFQTQ
jgi:hypothetical protein